MTQHPILLACAGAARCGKDELADVLVRERGFIKLAYGHVIKDFFSPYIAGEESAGDLRVRMRQANPHITDEAWIKFFDGVLMPFEIADLCCDAHTENDAEKSVLRPILEYGGDLIYDWVSHEYFRRIDAAWSAGKSVVNPRLVRTPEAAEWVKRGGTIVEVTHPERKPVSDWERDALELLRGSGYVANELANDGTLEAWHTRVRAFAHGLIHPQPLAERLGIKESA